MTFTRLTRDAFIFLFAAALGPTALPAQSHAIDVDHSDLKVHVFKSGLFSAFAHDHEIQAPITRGVVDASETASVELHVDSGKLRVLDPGTSEKDRRDIQKTMLGPEVLDTERFSEIVFKSSAAEPSGADHWMVRGELTLHGQMEPVAVEVTYHAGHYTGHTTLKQTEFGIKPLNLAGGTLKVKDDVRIDFDIQLAP